MRWHPVVSTGGNGPAVFPVPNSLSRPDCWNRAEVIALDELFPVSLGGHLGGCPILEKLLKVSAQREGDRDTFGILKWDIT